MIQNKIYGTISYSGGESDDFYYISIGSGMDTQTIMMFEGNLLIGGTMIESVAVNIGGGGGGGGSSGGSGFGGFGGGFGGFGSSGFGFGGNGRFFGFSASEVGTMATGGGTFAAALQDRATINQNYEYKYDTKTQSAEDLTKLNKARMEKIANRAKITGKAFGVAGSIVTAYQVYGDFSEERYYSAGTRAAVAGIAIASTAIPGVGWLIAGGIGIADAIWGDEFYNYIETKFGN